MDLKLISDKQKSEYNKLAGHVMQSWQWGEFRKNFGVNLLRYGLYKNGKLDRVFQLTVHKIPKINSYVGYLPKGPFPDGQLAQALTQVARENHCAFIKIEPNITIAQTNSQKVDGRFKPSPKPLFTKYNYVSNLDLSEAEILKKMHPKFRYNIKVAQKHGVVVEERTDDTAFEIYLKLYFYTTKRQGFHGHNVNYHKKLWEILKKEKATHLLIAFYQPPDKQERVPLAAWMLFNFKDTLYYAYGGSTDEYKFVMASNLIAWVAIQLGKKLGCKKFDLWGAAGPDVSPKDPYYGFTQFKSKMGADLIEYIGTYDLILNWPIYQAFTFIDKLMPLKVFLLKLIEKF